MAGIVKVFLDTEFTDFVNASLISMAMVTEAGEDLYIEVCFNVKQCSAFVREAVLPKLGQDPAAFCPRPALRSRILTWLDEVRPAGQEIVIAFDYDADWPLFVDALGGQVPAWCTGANVAGSLDTTVRQKFFAETGLPQHHALYDAHANRFAMMRDPFLRFQR